MENLQISQYSKINILATQEEKGYARQNGLIPGTYITIEFGGDVPAIFNGQITDLEEDMIELTQYETDKKIYIDFEGKGIPLELPIIDIKVFLLRKRNLFLQMMIKIDN